MSVSPARRVALTVLARVRRDGAFSGAVLAAELASGALSGEDASLATRLVYGTLAAEGVLDDALKTRVKGALEPGVRDVLRLAAFELLFSRAPVYAVVDQAVQAVRGVRPQATGLANAVLRRLAQDAPAFPWGDPMHDAGALARLTAHPLWIVDLFMSSLGPERGREALMADAEPAPTFVRVNPFVGDAVETVEMLRSIGAVPEPVPPDSLSYELRAPAAAFRATGIMDTRAVAMDAAAQVAPFACHPRPGVRILDATAGRGGKTLALQSIALGQGGPASITAADIHTGKVAALRERMDRLAVPGVVTVVRDALGSVTDEAPYDVVLLDAPCTGLGTLRRYPEKRWRLVPEDVLRLASLQLEMLEAASGVVRPGGRVVYSTCSIAVQETHDVVARFLSETPLGAEFAHERIAVDLPASWEPYREADGSFHSWPRSGGPDGHYVAALTRRERH